MKMLEAQYDTTSMKIRFPVFHIIFIFYDLCLLDFVYENYLVFVLLTECKPATFGFDCRSACHCANNSDCNRFNGSCANNVCAPGWQGNNCSIGKIYCYCTFGIISFLVLNKFTYNAYVMQCIIYL